MSIKLPNKEFFKLVEEQLNEDKVVEITVLGNSMLPFYKNGKTVVSIKRQNDYKKHDVILFIYNEKYILHRIIKIKKEVYIVKGDGALTSEAITKDKILGKAIDFHTSGRKVKHLKFKLKIWLLLTPFRRLLLKIIKK